ncbi:MAG: MBL fold metallo-hydrolase [Thermomicrobiales bacterium]
MTAHSDHLVELTRFPLVFPVSCYFVKEDDGLTLIDTGMSGTGKQILAAAEEIGQPIVRIALTHSHGDHAGSLDELHELLPDAEVLVGNREAKLLAGDRSLETGEPQEKLRGGYLTAETTPTRLLNHGDRVGSLEVLAAPGHTPGQIAFFDTRDQTLIAGDAFQTRAGIAVSGTVKWLFPFPAFATWHKPTALESAHLLRALAPSRLAVGHGKVLENPAGEMDRAIADAESAWGRAAVHVA